MERVVESGGPLAGASGAERGRPLLLVGVMDSAFTHRYLSQAKKHVKEQEGNLCPFLPGVEEGSRTFSLVCEEVKG